MATQAAQFKKLKSDLKQLSTQIIDFKAENYNLRSELEILKCKVASFEDAGSTNHNTHVVS